MVKLEPTHSAIAEAINNQYLQIRKSATTSSIRAFEELAMNISNVYANETQNFDRGKFLMLSLNTSINPT